MWISHVSLLESERNVKGDLYSKGTMFSLKLQHNLYLMLELENIKYKFQKELLLCYLQNECIIKKV